MQTPAIQAALLLYVVLMVQAALFVLVTWGLAAALGGRATAAQIGLPRVLRVKLAGVDLQIGPLPAISSVTLLGRGPADSYEGPGSFRRLGLARRLTILLGPWMITLTLAILCLAPARGLESFANAFPQLLLVLDTTPLVRGFLRVLREEPWSITMGVLFAKLTAVNLLPLATLAGGAALHEITLAIKRPEKPEDEAPRALWPALSVLFLLFYVGGRFAYGLIRALS